MTNRIFIKLVIVIFLSFYTLIASSQNNNDHYFKIDSIINSIDTGDIVIIDFISDTCEFEIDGRKIEFVENTRLIDCHGVSIEQYFESLECNSGNNFRLFNASYYYMEDDRIKFRFTVKYKTSNESKLKEKSSTIKTIWIYKKDINSILKKY